MLFCKTGRFDLVSGSSYINKHNCRPKPWSPSCFMILMSLTENRNIFTLLDLCQGNLPVTCGFPSQWPVTQSFDVFFAVPLNRCSRCRWFETLWRSLWRHWNVIKKNLHIFPKHYIVTWNIGLKKLEGGYTGFTLSVRPSVCRRHGFRSISQVCFGMSISNFICMLMVAIGRSLSIFSDVTFKMAAWRPYWIFWFVL